MSGKPIVLLGEAWGKNEERIQRPFVGASGVLLLNMLSEAGVTELTRDDRHFINRYYRENDPTMIDAVWEMHPEFRRTNVFNIHPPGDKVEWFCGPKAEGIHGWPSLVKGKYVRKEFEHELERLADELLEWDPDLIVCLGNTPTWALYGSTGISKLRGTTVLSTHLVTDFKLLLAYHPAAIIRQWEYRPLTIVDFMQIPEENSFPEIRRPHREIWIEPSLEDMERFYDEHILPARPNRLGIDIETSGSQITSIAFSPRPDISLVVPFIGRSGKRRDFWPTPESERDALDYVRKICEDRTILKVFQNGTYDISFLWRAYGIRTYGAEDDTMLLQHALQPEALKGLGFLGSVYTREGPWKVERGKEETIKRDA